ncbi:homoserine kinase [Nocardioides mangrovicus]|uniref:Homoserine kinase n=1 Tax=Nocardioides mangrovicus TaxID=2478913 RepID=A0A3L8P7U0_9ACTN|nr:homoserine kinase [Nocardioides mangrovicus]RLV51022.1 homoserine kinase [Nocardioides mangrovicus]
MSATVTVPATSANLGPGFDSLGLALDLRDTVTAIAYDGPLQIHVEGEGAGDVPLTHEHLVHVVMDRTFALLGVEAPGVRLHCRNVVPHARGLGSSSAAIVAGVLLARALVEGGAERLDDDGALALAVELEGHPDNVAPAMLGGFTVAAGDTVARLDVDPRVAGVLFVPPHALSTKAARDLLPETVAHRDAAANAGRAALLVAALTAHPELLLEATEDRLHQEYRRPAMPESLALVDELRADGVAAVVSGAGPTVLALTSHDRASSLAARVPAGWQVHTPVIGGPGAALI